MTRASSVAEELIGSFMTPSRVNNLNFGSLVLCAEPSSSDDLSLPSQLVG
jgi:hypothetical protein